MGESTPADATGFGAFDFGVVTAPAAATPLVHLMDEILTRPYWADEAWVVTLTRVDLSDLTTFSSSTPIGWLLVARLVPGTGLQRHRLLPLAFSIAVVIVSYVFVRTLRWRSRRWARLAGTIVGVVVMMAPVSLLRNDLKQYTCDACFALLLLMATARAERCNDRRSIVWVGTISVVAVPFSTTSVFVAIAAFAGLLVAAIRARSRPRVANIAAVGGIAAVILAAYLVLLVLPHVTTHLRQFWSANYLRGSLAEMLAETWTRVIALAPRLAIPAAAAVALFVTGIVVLERLGQTAVAAAVVALWVEAFVLGALQRYPFLNPRTNHYLLVPTLVVIGLGSIGLIAKLVGNRHPAIGTVLAVIVTAVFVRRAQPFVGTLNIRHEDARAAAAYVSAHRRDGDVVLVSAFGTWSFSYYWPEGAIRLHEAPGFIFVAEARAADAMYASRRTKERVLEALQQALDRQRAAGPNSRVFIVRSHVTDEEVEAWEWVFSFLDITPRLVGSGPEPVVVIDHQATTSSPLRSPR